MKRLNNKGFSIIELLLILLLIILLILLSWYIYGQSQKQDESSSPQSSAQQSTPNKPDEQPAQQEDAPQYVEIKQLGIKFVPNETTKDFVYSIRNSQLDDGTKLLIADTSTQALIKQSSECTAEKAVATGAIARGDGDYPANATGPTSSPGTLVKQFDKFYITFDTPQAYCSQDQAIQKKTSSISKDLKAALASVVQL